MRTITVFFLAASGAWAQTALMEQFQFESKLLPNLHHFLYTLARARNNAPDRERAAVKGAPLDVEGFAALSAERKKAWDEAVELYRANAASLNISYGPLVDVNYAVADSKLNEIQPKLREALSKAEPIYRDVWWPRHDASNRAWIRDLRPRVEALGPKIAAQLAAAFHHDWPTGPLRVEVTAYANFAGAYTTDDPPLITMASLGEEQLGDDALEELFHECSHLMMGTIDAGLEKRTKAAGKTLSRDVSHTILFYTVGETLRRAVPGHVPYAVHYGVWKRGWQKNFELLQLYWQPYLDGKCTLDEALDRIVAAL
jgi:hypothetical protein